MNLARYLTRSAAPLSLDEWASYFSYGGNAYQLGLNQTASGAKQEPIGADFRGLTSQAYKQNGIVFACMLARQLLFQQTRFQFRQLGSGWPGDLFGNPDLKALEEPWAGGTTRALLARAIQDADLAGNWFCVRRPGNKLKRMRPDWVTIVLGSDSDPEVVAGDVDAEALGYIYEPGGPGSGQDVEVYLRDEVAHFAPIPDPTASYRGMSWLTPVIREIMADKGMTDHKITSLESGMTPNLVVKIDPNVRQQAAEEWIKKFRGEYEGVQNAGKTMFLGGGADATVVGANFEQMTFRDVQGAGEPLALDTPIPTPTGWTTMLDIRVGDQVFGRTGEPANVVAVLPIHHGRECYRVTFSDRTAIVADAGHVWCVIDRMLGRQGEPDVDGVRRRAEREHTTAELHTLIDEWDARGNGGNRFGIPAGDPVELEHCDLLVDPYVLGVWLGDGQTAGAAICGAEPDLAFIASEIERRGYTVTRWATKPGKASVVGIPGGLLAALDALGVLGDKHIPDDYLRSSLEQRLDLFRGLMDTDGSVGSIGKETCEYSSKYEHLARQVAELARSLGYRATLSRKADVRSRTGATWRVMFRADPDVIPFLLERKASRCQTPVWVKNRAVVAVEPVDSVPVRCIAVDTEDHLFRAGEGWTLTHNTRIAAAARLHPVIVGLSEGLQGSSLNVGNFTAARRLVADGTMRPLWQDICGSLAPIIKVPAGAELWYDDAAVPFLQEDVKDAADIQQTQAISIRQLVDSGFEWGSVVDAVTSGDLSKLKHTGLMSVQLLPPGSRNGNKAGTAVVPVE